MDPATVNTFLDRFLAVADSGFGLIAGDIGYVLNALIIISITLAGAQWALAQEAPMAAFFRKVLFVGLFAFLINNWDALSTAINQSGAMLGLRAGGDGMSMADLRSATSSPSAPCC
jgi:type IV secretion system protein TrbL